MGNEEREVPAVFHGDVQQETDQPQRRQEKGVITKPEVLQYRPIMRHT